MKLKIVTSTSSSSFEGLINEFMANHKIIKIDYNVQTVVAHECPRFTYIAFITYEDIDSDNSLGG